jgi:hypothetical protein
LQTRASEATTPNQLYKAASDLPNAVVVKDPGTRVKKTFLQAVTGGGKQKAAEKSLN